VTERGVVLVAVLLVTALVTMVTATVMFRVRAEVATSAARDRGEQAFAAALSGVQRAVAVLRATGADPLVCGDNPELFQNQLVAEDGANAWYFSVYGDDPTEQTTTVRYGVTDESGKINLSTASAETLAALRGMTAELVASLLDYRDADADTRQDGAEQDYYDDLAVPYAIANGPLGTLEELLLVKGFTGAVVYGEDVNFNGILDANEDDGDETFPPDDRNGQLDKGLRGVATVWTRERDVDSRGRPRASLQSGEALQRSGLPRATLDFIRVYREEGNALRHPSELLELRYQLKRDARTERGSLRAGTWIESGVGAAELPNILDRLTGQPPDSRRPLVGLVNVNTASVEVLTALLGGDASLAQQIVDVRSDLDPETLATPGWLYTQNLVDAGAFKVIAPRLTARSSQFSVRCVGFGAPCGRYRILEAVVDLSASASAPRVVYLRDISRVGLPFALDPEAIQRTR